MKKDTMAIIHITDLKISTLIGTNDWERTKKQQVVLNIQVSYDASEAVKSDSITDALDYKTLKKQIIAFVENSHYGLLEKLTQEILTLILQNKRILSATVRIDKPKALRFAKSVAVEMTASQT